MTIVATGVHSHWTQANNFELVLRHSHGRPQGRIQEGRLRRSLPPKTNELTLFTKIVYTSENSIRIFAIQGYFVIHCFVTEVLGSVLYLS